MPQPHRRNKGEVLAQQMSDHAAPRSIDSRRDRLVAQRSRTDAKWADAAARLDAPEVASVSTPAARILLAEQRQEARRLAKAQRASALAFSRVLDTPCATHGVASGTPCWSVPGEDRDHPALCPHRTRAAGYTGVSSPRSTRRRAG